MPPGVRCRTTSRIVHRLLSDCSRTRSRKACRMARPISGSDSSTNSWRCHAPGNRQSGRSHRHRLWLEISGRGSRANGRARSSVCRRRSSHCAPRARRFPVCTIFFTPRYRIRASAPAVSSDDKEKSGSVGASELRDLDFKSSISLDGTRPPTLDSPLSYGAMLAWSRNWTALCPHCLRNRSRRYRIPPRGSAASRHNHIRRRIGGDIPSTRSCDRNRPPSLSRLMSGSVRAWRAGRR